MSEKESQAEQVVEVEEKAPKPSPRPEMKMWMAAAVIVVVMILLGSLAYVMTKPEDKDEDVLEAAIEPSPAVVDAGQSVELAVNVTWDGEQIEDPENLSFEWSVDDADLGTMNVTGGTATFESGVEGGQTVVWCNVTYVVEDDENWVLVNATLTVNPPVLASVEVTPGDVTIIFDEVVVLNATALDSVGQDVSDEGIEWTVEGLPAGNYTLNATEGRSVNFTANATGTAWVNATLTYGGVTKSAGTVLNVIRQVPSVDIDNTRITDGVMWTFTEPSDPLSWDEILIVLTDGTNVVNWTISSEGLDNGSYSVAPYPQMTLGDVTVYLNITDTTGNATVNAGDFFTFTSSSGKFLPAHSYAVTLVYVPTSDEIVTRLFTG